MQLNLVAFVKGEDSLPERSKTPRTSARTSFYRFSFIDLKIWQPERKGTQLNSFVTPIGRVLVAT